MVDSDPATKDYFAKHLDNMGVDTLFSKKEYLLLHDIAASDFLEKVSTESAIPFCDPDAEALPSTCKNFSKCTAALRKTSVPLAVTDEGK